MDKDTTHTAAEGDVNFAAPIKSVSIDAMLRMREAVLDRVSKAIELLQEADQIAGQANIGFARVEVPINGSRSGTSLLSPDALPTIREEIDRGAWHHLMNESGLRSVMDARAREQWDEGLRGHDVPALTKENIEATFLTMHAARGEMFDRGVINAFRRLSWDFKTNNPYRLGKRIILTCLVDVRPWRSGGHSGITVFAGFRRADELDDLLRVFHVLDGKTEPDHRNGAYRQLSDAINQNQWACENEYFSLRWFRKGTGHLTFKRLDLVDQLNTIIARHYPGALAHERAA